MKEKEYLAQVPPSQSILNGITSDDISKVMNEPRDLADTIDNWGDLIEVISRKCPGLQFLVHQYILGVDKLRKKIKENNEERGHDFYCAESVNLEKFIAQTKVVFNVLALIHNKEEAKRLEEMFYEESSEESNSKDEGEIQTD